MALRAKPAAAFVAAVVLLAVAPPAPASSGKTTQVSGASDGSQPNGPTPAATVPDTTSPALSLDGRTVAFSSDASNLVPGDANNAADVFVRDLATGASARASLTADGREANGASYSPALSVDGHYLAFVSSATNLVPGDTNGMPDVFVRSLRTGKIRRVSVSSTGAQADGASNSPFVSAFGEWVTFDSAATNLAAGDTNLIADAFIHDRRTRMTSRIKPPGLPSGRQTLPPEAGADEPRHPHVLWTERATVSYDGRFIAFLRGASRALASSDPFAPAAPFAQDVFVWDRVSRKVEPLPAPSWGGETAAMNANPVISADGRRIAFESWVVVRDHDVVAPNPLDLKDILVWDQVARNFGSASINTWYQGGNADSYSPSLSADGQVVAFVSDATNLVAGDTNNLPDVFARDSRDRTTTRMSIGPGAAQADGASARPQVSYEGRNVVFSSAASTLAAGDTNLVSDVFWRDRRIDSANRAPDLSQPFKGTRRLDAFQETSLRLRARDADGDPLRFGSIFPLPKLASLDPATGEFHWTPTPDEAGRRDIAFWVEDPRGARDFAVVRYYVRAADETAACRISPRDC